MKVIFLAFANSSSSPLPNLVVEDDGIFNILSQRYLRGDYFIHREPFATVEKINAALKKYENNLAIFHYSGHAGKDRLFIDDKDVYSKGIAKQLRNSAEKGVLKLVILNGCSTFGQVELLKENKVPVIISTSARVNDFSAKEFSIRFWENLVGRMLTIEDSFHDALGPAEAVTDRDLLGSYKRHIDTEMANEGDKDLPIWSLYGREEDIKLKPIPIRDKFEFRDLPMPNDQLIETLFETLYEAGNPQIVTLHETPGVRRGDKTAAILNTIPHPIGIHLQRLLSPQFPTEYAEDSPNNFGMARLQQIAQLFHTSTEFLAIVMIAQIWELILRFQDVFVIEPFIKEKLSEYIYIDKEARKTYSYIPFIQEIRQYLITKNVNGEIKSFIDEQEVIGDLLIDSEEFSQACTYLYGLRKQIVRNTVNEDEIMSVSIEAEKHLLSFIKPLGFIHRYDLVSIQQIEILKYRHTKISSDVLNPQLTPPLIGNDLYYKHRLIRCMQSTSDDEYDYYYMPSFVDNWSVMLIKTKIEEIIDDKRRRFKVTPIGYLNLSPFMIDKNAFIKRTNLSYIMFFNGFRKQKPTLSYQWVRNPMNYRDSIEISDEEEFEPILLEFDAFEKMIR